LPYQNVSAELKERFVAAGDELDDAVYPELYNLSSRFFSALWSKLTKLGPRPPWRDPSPR
jgi:hypothetical protein